MEKLKVGDKVYRKEYQRWGNDLRSYNFTEVERLTPTRAILKNGVVLINEPKDYRDNPEHFEVHGDRWSKYKRITDDIVKEQADWTKLVMAKRFVDAQKWNDEQYLKIYELFNTDF